MCWADRLKSACIGGGEISFDEFVTLTKQNIYMAHGNYHSKHRRTPMITYKSGERISQVREAEYESITLAIVASIAILKDCSWTELPGLFGPTNPEALNRLFDGTDPGEELRVELTFGEYLATCEKSGLVTGKRRQLRFTEMPISDRVRTSNSSLPIA